MKIDHDTCYRAVRSRDCRFDGRFFTGVTSTGVYCRPVCPARAPRRENCTFFACAAAAEEAGFRPCRRCRPETAPGSAAWRGTSATVARALKLIGEGALDGASVPQLADRLGVGERHLRRLFLEHLGAAPGAVARTRRVHFARQLLDETALSMGAVALAAGYGSVRRFNAAVKVTFRRSPAELREASRGRAAARAGVNGWITLHLLYRAPYDWSMVTGYLGARAIPRVEAVVADAAGPPGGPREYRRIVCVEDACGMVVVRPAVRRDGLDLRVESGLIGGLLDITCQVRRLFDLDADPGAIGRRLAEDPLLAPLVARRPGLRVPGAWDRWELAVRAVLGQQVTVAGASTLAGRVVERYGKAVFRDGEDGKGETWRLFPGPRRLLAADPAVLRIPSARAAALRALAAAVLAEPHLLDGSLSSDEVASRLVALPGIGPWTAGYIALRALGDPDALPAGDLGLRRALEAEFDDRRPKIAEVRERAERWRPWRGYAVMHLWHA